MSTIEKFKICPTCGTKNDPRSMECSDCGTDLMGIPVVDNESLKKDVPSKPEAEVIENAEANHSELVRVCSCGAINPAQARKCLRCGEDLSDTYPQVASPVAEAHYQLEDVDSGSVFRIPCGNIVIGREHEMREYLLGKTYVSRAHAKLSVLDGKLFVENLSTTNFTFVNNIRIADGKQELHPGDELALGGITVSGVRQSNAAYFIVGLAP